MQLDTNPSGSSTLRGPPTAFAVTLTDPGQLLSCGVDIMITATLKIKLSAKQIHNAVPLSEMRLDTLNILAVVISTREAHKKVNR